jgi:hypothetical protein
MTFTEIVRSLPASRDLVQSAVLALRPAPRRNLTGHVGTLGLGIALGAGVALLYAPKSGRELRRQISARIDETVHHHHLEEGATLGRSHNGGSRADHV